MPPIRKGKPPVGPPAPPVKPPLPPGPPRPPGPIVITPGGPPAVDPNPPQGPPVVGDGNPIPTPPRERIRYGLVSVHGIGPDEVALVIALPDNRVMASVMTVAGAGAKIAGLLPLIAPDHKGARKEASVVSLASDEITLADVLAQLQVLIVNSEQVNSRLAAIEEHLAGAETEQPPAPPVSTDVTFWDMFMAAPNPDPETWQPEAFTVYDRSRVLMQWRAQYSPKGVRVYQDVERQMSLIRHIYADPTDPVTVAFLEEGHTVESAVYAILSGRVDEIVQSVEFGTRQKDAVIRLGKHDAQWMFERDIAKAGQGGTPSGN